MLTPYDRPASTLDPRRWFALALLAIADCVVILDATVVNIALPSIGKAFHASTGELSWVVSAYVLAFGGLLLLGGRLADLFGRRRLFIGGLIVFGLASLAGGLATSTDQLIAARALQGLGAAALAPAARSIVTTIFPEGPERSKALGIWAAVAGSGSVIGLVLGGVLTSGLSWNWVLFINVPITLGAAMLAPRLLSESRAGTNSRSVDLTGAALVTAGLVSALYALVQANSAGWGSLQTIGLLALGCVLLALFVWFESRTDAALMPLRFFGLRQIRGANIAMALVAAAMVGLFFILVLYQQQVEGYSALNSGLSQLPLGLALITVAGLAGPLTERIGAKPVLIGGTAILAVGIGWLSRIPVHGSYLADILGPSLVIGVGLGLAFVSLMVASASGITADDAGLAGGLINTTQQIGGAIGLAIVTAIASSRTPTVVHSLSQLDDGFRTALLVVAGIAASATVAAALLLPGRSRVVAGGLAAVVPVTA